MQKLRRLADAIGIRSAYALIPLLLANGPGSEIQKPLAIVVVGLIALSSLVGGGA